MNGGFVTKRKAEEFDALLSRSRIDDAGEYAELLELVSSIRDLPEVSARPEFVATLRERLVAEAAAMPTTTVDRATAAHLTPAHPAVRRERRIATILGGFAIASATTSMAVASQGALPGEVLYPIKRAIEAAETGLQSDESDKAATLLDHAAQRLEEAQRLAAEGDDAEALSQALGDLEMQTSEASGLAISDYESTGDSSGIVALDGFTGAALAELTAMSPMVPSEARPALISAVQTLREIDATSHRACPTCLGPAGAPQLLSSVEDLLTGEPAEMQSLASKAQEIADQTPESEDVLDPTAPTTSEPGTPDPTISPTTEPTDQSDPIGDTEQELDEQIEEVADPMTTLIDEVTGELEDLHQEAEDEWDAFQQSLEDELSGG